LAGGSSASRFASTHGRGAFPATLPWLADASYLRRLAPAMRGDTCNKGGTFELSRPMLSIQGVMHSIYVGQFGIMQTPYAAPH